MNLFLHELKNNLIEYHDEASESSGGFESNNENFQDNFDDDDDYRGVKNFLNRRRNSVAHKAILDRAYKFIYDEDFSSDGTSGSEYIGAGNFFGKNYVRCLEFNKTFGNRSRNRTPQIWPKENLRRSEMPAFHRKRKFPSIEFQARFNNYPEVLSRRKICDKFSKSKRFTKMRKINSERILSNGNNGGGSGSSSSNESFAFEVAQSLQEKLRSTRRCLRVETMILESRNRKYSDFSYLDDQIKRIESRLSDTQENEVRLLEDIKKRIDEDFDLERIKVAGAIFESSKSSNVDYEDFLGARIVDKNLYKISDHDISKVAKIVDSIDSGVSTDLSRPESDVLSRTDLHIESKYSLVFFNDTRNPNSQQKEDCFEIIPSFNYSDLKDDLNEEKALDDQVEKAVQKFTEDLIIWERRAVERGLDVDTFCANSVAAKKIKKSLKKLSPDCSDSSETKTSSSPCEFSERSNSCSEDEYLDNISPPSFCSISDSDVENL